MVFHIESALFSPVTEEVVSNTTKSIRGRLLHWLDFIHRPYFLLVDSKRDLINEHTLDGTSAHICMTGIYLWVIKGGHIHYFCTPEAGRINNDPNNLFLFDLGPRDTPLVAPSGGSGKRRLRGS